MAPSNSQGSDSPATTSEELSELKSEVKSEDSNDPLVAPSNSQGSDSPATTSEELSELKSEVKSEDSNDPLVAPSNSQGSDSPATTSEELSEVKSEVKSEDSNDPLVPDFSFVASVGECNKVRVRDSVDPLVPTYDRRGLWGNTIFSPSDEDEETSAEGCSNRSPGNDYFHHELRHMWNWYKVNARLGTEEQCIAFAKQRGMMPIEKQCSRHHTAMCFEANRGGPFGTFCCRKGLCRNKSIPTTRNTFFEDAELPLVQIFQLMYAFANKCSYHEARLQNARDDNERVFSKSTVWNWYSCYREAIVVYVLEHQDQKNKIGGPNKIVKISNSKCGKRKYKRGSHIEGLWVICMIESGKDDLRLEVCPDIEGKSEVLVPLIKKHVQEGSIIHTDHWEAYNCLPEHGYIHKRVNHSCDPEHSSVAPDGTCTQQKEYQWLNLIKRFRKKHKKRDFTDWLCEQSWRRRIRLNHLDPFEELLRVISYVYRFK